MKGLSGTLAFSVVWVKHGERYGADFSVFADVSAQKRDQIALSFAVQF